MQRYNIILLQILLFCGKVNTIFQTKGETYKNPGYKSNINLSEIIPMLVLKFIDLVFTFPFLAEEGGLNGTKQQGLVWCWCVIFPWCGKIWFHKFNRSKQCLVYKTCLKFFLGMFLGPGLFSHNFV